METFEIIDSYGKICECLEAKNARQALCRYLMEHEELEDMVLYKSAFWDRWTLAEYDNEDEYFIARKMHNM